MGGPNPIHDSGDIGASVVLGGFRFLKPGEIFLRIGTGRLISYAEMEGETYFEGFWEGGKGVSSNPGVLKVFGGPRVISGESEEGDF